MLFFFFQDYLLKGYHNIGALDILAPSKQMPGLHKEIQTAFKFHLSGLKSEGVQISFVSVSLVRVFFFFFFFWVGVQGWG